MTRAARLLRFLLVCLALAWVPAPASAAPMVDAIVLVAAAPGRAIERVAPSPAARLARPAFFFRAASAPRARLGVQVAPALALLPPRRIYLVVRALLC